MKSPILITVMLSLFLIGGCATLKAKDAPPPQEIPKPVSLPVGKNWQVVEEAPQLTNERHNRLPFQTEESLLPEGATTAPPEEQRKLETPR